MAEETVKLNNNIVLALPNKDRGGKLERKVFKAGDEVPRALVASILKADPRFDADHADNLSEAQRAAKRKAAEEQQLAVAKAAEARILEHVGKLPKRGR